MTTKLCNGRILSQDQIVVGKALYFEQGKIKGITSEDLPADVTIDVNNRYVSAGFIDLHTHGGGGFDFMDTEVAAVREAMKTHGNHGTTSIMPTTLSCSTDALKSSFACIKEALLQQSGLPHFLGVHLEGPYFSVSQCGAQNPEYIKNPDRAEYEKILQDSFGLIRRWSFAPELPGSNAFCDFLLQNDIVPSIAHTDASYEEVCRVYEKGCRLLTHFYSCMSGITREKGARKLGVIEAGYCLDDMYIELIADGMHLPPDLLKMIVKLKCRDKICLVTDSMRGAGQKDGRSFLGRKGEETPCIIEDGVAKLMDKSAYAGSVATADRLIRTMVKQADVSLIDAVKMMTKNPADAMKLQKKGQLLDGYDADICVFDENIVISHVFVSGIQINDTEKQ